MSGTPIRLDTHVVVWLYDGRTDQFSERSLQLIDQRLLTISPMVELELEYLHEVGRLTASPSAMVRDLETRIGLERSTETFAAVVAAASELSWTRDAFDRLIVADASAAACELLTKDRMIRQHYPLAVW